jgi:hypothetical protein
MDIETLLSNLAEGARENFKEFGFVTPATLFIMNDSLAPLPDEVMELFSKDKPRYFEAVRRLVKKHSPDAVAVICEAWFVDDFSAGLVQPSLSPGRKECVFITVDSRDRQVTCAAEVKNGKLGDWNRHPAYEKNSVNDKMITGNLIDFYGTGTNLNLPIDMLRRPADGTGPEKID